MQHILTAALAAIAPPDRTPQDFVSRLDQVEVVRGEDDAQMIAYDSAGEVIGTIALWVEPDGRIHLASDYGDGYAETVLTDGRARTEATLPLEVVSMRADAMLGAIDYGRDTAWEGKLECALKLGLAAASCTLANFTCPLAMGAAACACLPLIIEEWQEYSCPVL